MATTCLWEVVEGGPGRPQPVLEGLDVARIGLAAYCAPTASTVKARYCSCSSGLSEPDDATWSSCLARSR